MDIIKISLVGKGRQKIIASITFDEGPHKYLHSLVTPWIEYDCVINDVPDSVAIVPFVAAILPIAWLCDAEVVVADNIDADFLNAVERIKQGFQQAYPMLNFGGKITATPVHNVPHQQILESACLFSGGIHGWASLMRHIDEKPLMISLCGSDIAVTNRKAWRTVNKVNKQTAKDFGLEYTALTTNFREVIKEKALNKLVKESGESWWQGFQQGILLAAYVAPLAYVYGLRNIYNVSKTGVMDCCGCHVIDDDSNSTDRLAKFRYLCSLPDDIISKIKFHVCEQPNSDGNNCCRCEKCYRTILTLVAVNCLGGVERFGFAWDDKAIRRCHHFFKTDISVTSSLAMRYYPAIQQEFIKNKESIHDFAKYDWFVKMDFSKIDEYAVKKVRRFFKKVKVATRKAWRRIGR